MEIKFSKPFEFLALIASLLTACNQSVNNENNITAQANIIKDATFKNSPNKASGKLKLIQLLSFKNIDTVPSKSNLDTDNGFRGFKFSSLLDDYDLSEFNQTEISPSIFKGNFVELYASTPIGKNLFWINGVCFNEIRLEFYQKRLFRISMEDYEPYCRARQNFNKVVEIAKQKYGEPNSGRIKQIPLYTIDLSNLDPIKCYTVNDSAIWKANKNEFKIFFQVDRDTIKETLKQNIFYWNRFRIQYVSTRIEKNMNEDYLKNQKINERNRIKKQMQGI